MKASIIKTLESIKHEVRDKYKAQIRGVFGSYSRGEQRKNSDIDILVDFLEGATLFDLSGLGNFLEEKLGCKVDVVSRRALRKEIEPYVYDDLVEL